MRKTIIILIIIALLCSGFLIAFIVFNSDNDSEDNNIKTLDSNMYEIENGSITIDVKNVDSFINDLQTHADEIDTALENEHLIELYYVNGIDINNAYIKLFKYEDYNSIEFRFNKYDIEKQSGYQYFVTINSSDGMDILKTYFDKICEDYNISFSFNKLKNSDSYERVDGPFKLGDYTYKYKITVSGRIPSSRAITTYCFYSNVEEISFHRAWLASGLSSNLDDYFEIEEAVTVLRADCIKGKADY